MLWYLLNYYAIKIKTIKKNNLNQKRLHQVIDKKIVKFKKKIKNSIKPKMIANSGRKKMIKWKNPKNKLNKNDFISTKKLKNK